MLKDAPTEVARFDGHGTCVLAVGDRLTFREAGDGQLYDVKFDIPTPQVPEFEDSRIEEWHHVGTRGGCSYGFSERGCSRLCRIYCRADDVITEGEMTIGAWIRHSVEEQHDGRTKASKISIYKN
jgi:hypothetical protein